MTTLPLRSYEGDKMSQKLINEVKALKERVSDLEEKLRFLTALVATKRRTKDVEVRSEAH